MGDASISPESKFSQSFASDYIEQTRVHLNFNQNVVITTEDRIELCLRNHLESISSTRAWITPVSLFVAFLTTLSTSTFKDALFLPAATWHALFLLLSIASAVWSIVAIMRAVRSKSSLRCLLNEIKQSAKVASDLDESGA